MASNRAQRRAAYKKGKRPGETYADQLARQKNIKEAIEKVARDETLALETDIKTQRFLWMAVVANYEAFGHAGVRAQRFMLTLDNVREDMEKMAAKDGWEYAVEKLREQCEKITGMEVKQVHEDRMIQARKENEAKGIFFPAEDPEELAKIGFTGTAAGPKWIPVTEKLPERGQWVLAYRGRFISPDVISHRFWETSHNTWRLTTHWMPFPEFPKELADDVAKSLLQEKIADAED